jgi:hypothetical protein
VKSYEVLNESQLPNGTWASTLRVIVSVDKLTTFVEAKGITVEIKGGLFALNIKQQLLNEQGEINAMANMFGILHETMQVAFDYTIKSEEPKSLDAESKNWEIPLTVTSTANKNIDFCANYFMKTISAISLTQEEVDIYKSLNKNVYKLVVKPSGDWEETKVFFFRKKNSIDIISSLISNWEFYIRLFAVQSGIDEKNGEGKGNVNPLFENNLRYPVNLQTVATYTLNDKKTLNQIEQINGYSIKPRGVISYFKHGGYVVYEDNGHGLVATITDLDLDDGYGNWNTAKTACKDLILNGYSDWYLPSKDELNAIFVNVKQLGLGSFNNKYTCYWSSTEYVTNYAWYINFSEGTIKNGSYGNEFNVRAVRAF